MPVEIHIVLASTQERARARAKQLVKGLPHQFLDLGNCGTFAFQDREGRKPSFKLDSVPGQGVPIHCVAIRIEWPGP